MGRHNSVLFRLNSKCLQGLFVCLIVIMFASDHCRYLYELGGHLHGFLISAENARFFFLPPFSPPTFRSILVQLAAVSQCKKGTFRMLAEC